MINIPGLSEARSNLITLRFMLKEDLNQQIKLN